MDFFSYSLSFALYVVAPFDMEEISEDSPIYFKDPFSHHAHVRRIAEAAYLAYRRVVFYPTMSRAREKWVSATQLERLGKVLEKLAPKIQPVPWENTDPEYPHVDASKSVNLESLSKLRCYSILWDLVCITGQLHMILWHYRTPQYMSSLQDNAYLRNRWRDHVAPPEKNRKIPDEETTRMKLSELKDALEQFLQMREDMQVEEKLRNIKFDVWIQNRERELNATSSNDPNLEGKLIRLQGNRKRFEKNCKRMREDRIQHHKNRAHKDALVSQFNLSGATDDSGTRGYEYRKLLQSIRETSAADWSAVGHSDALGTTKYLESGTHQCRDWRSFAAAIGAMHQDCKPLKPKKLPKTVTENAPPLPAAPAFVPSDIYPDYYKERPHETPPGILLDEQDGQTSDTSSVYPTPPPTPLGEQDGQMSEPSSYKAQDTPPSTPGDEWPEWVVNPVKSLESARVVVKPTAMRPGAYEDLLVETKEVMKLHLPLSRNHLDDIRYGEKFRSGWIPVPEAAILFTMEPLEFPMENLIHDLLYLLDDPEGIACDFGELLSKSCMLQDRGLCIKMPSGIRSNNVDSRSRQTNSKRTELHPSANNYTPRIQGGREREPKFGADGKMYVKKETSRNVDTNSERSMWNRSERPRRNPSVPAQPPRRDQQRIEPVRHDSRGYVRELNATNTNTSKIIAKSRPMQPPGTESPGKLSSATKRPIPMEQSISLSPETSLEINLRCNLDCRPSSGKSESQRGKEQKDERRIKPRSATPIEQPAAFNPKAPFKIEMRYEPECRPSSRKTESERGRESERRGKRKIEPRSETPAQPRSEAPIERRGSTPSVDSTISALRSNLREEEDGGRWSICHRDVN